MRNKWKLDSGLLSQELKLLLELIRSNDNDNDNIKLNQNEWFQGIDWEHFLELAKHHRVYPLIYLKLN